VKSRSSANFARRVSGRTVATAEAEAEQTAQRVSKSLLRFRKAGGFTQAQLAHAAGVTVETVARLERVVRGAVSANTNPSLETLVRLSHALGVETKELLS
jgi:DNA-binding XRE family transcriptional regulator